ncbi:MAG: outer membrane protein assembly factor BamE [Candidatus Marinimicrobia bacterium]|nr:outer membrane protein assembly factor BamE [Candidatus Neomarinimicrobiota bacterium]
MKNQIAKQNIIIILLIAFLLISCATIGHDFRGKYVTKIKIGETKKSDVQKMFGNPWRVGIDSGDKSWTYGYYHFKLFKGIETKDLYVTFDSTGVVNSYTYNKSDFKKKNKR